MGISYVVHALEAEIHGREWDAPSSLHEGLNVNVLQESLDVALRQSSSQGKAIGIYRGVTAATTWTVLVFLLWHLWQQWWHRAEGRVIMLPTRAYTSLVKRTRNDLEAEGMSDVRVSTGDILAAWFFKVPASHLVTLERFPLLFNLSYRSYIQMKHLAKRLFIARTWHQSDLSTRTA
jgi:hypothetical protein